MRNWLFALIMIPTTSPEGWDTEKYRKIPGNVVKFTKTGTHIQVKKSASPLIYSLKDVPILAGFEVKGRFIGLPKAGVDDSPLRVGFILPGKKTLSGFKRLFAADWVLRLYEKAPKGSGIAGIHFFNVTLEKEKLGTTRTHPASDLIKESFFAFQDEPGEFDFKYKFEKPLKAAAIWIAIDGDDSKTEYDVHINDLKVLRSTPAVKDL